MAAFSCIAPILNFSVRHCQLCFSHGPSSSGPADTEVRAPPITMAGGAPALSLSPTCSPDAQHTVIGWVGHTHFPKVGAP